MGSIFSATSLNRQTSISEERVNRMTKMIIAIMIFGMMLISANQSALACQVDDFYLTKEGALASSSPEGLNEAIRLQEEGNKEKLGDLVKSGTVLQLAANVKVQVLERSFEFKMLKVLSPDRREPYWVKDGSLKQMNCN